MSTLVNISKEGKFTSLELVNQINVFREQEGNKSVLKHSDLLKKIIVEFEEEIGEGNISPTSYTDKSNRQSKMYELNGDEALQLLNSESKFVRKATVKLIRSMEEKINNLQPILPDFTNPAIAARAWADEVEQKQKVIEEKRVLEIQAAEDAPKLEVYEGLIDTEQLISMQTAANNLNVGLITLYGYLRKMKILKSSYEQKNRPYQTYIDKGYFDVKSKPYKNSITGKSGISFSTYVTGLGMAWLEQNLPDNM